MDNVQNNKMFLKENSWASLVVQWLRIRLAMQGTLIQSLVQEDPTCLGDEEILTGDKKKGSQKNESILRSK